MSLTIFFLKLALAFLNKKNMPLEYLICYPVFKQHSATRPSTNVIEAWKSGHTGKGITIAMVDNGVDINHPDLKANIVSL